MDVIFGMYDNINELEKNSRMENELVKTQDEMSMGIIKVSKNRNEKNVQMDALNFCTDVDPNARKTFETKNEGDFPVYDDTYDKCGQYESQFENDRNNMSQIDTQYSYLNTYVYQNDQYINSTHTSHELEPYKYNYNTFYSPSNVEQNHTAQRLENEKKKEDKTPVCTLCNQLIEDPFLNSMISKQHKTLFTIHEKCNRCCVCKKYVEGSSFIHEGELYCKSDYSKYHLKDCSICGEKITPIAMYYNVEENKFACHDKCLYCCRCGHYMTIGSDVTVYRQKIYCLPCREYIATENVECNDDGYYASKHIKRARTVLTAQQRKLFNDTFMSNPKPSRKTREFLATSTGLKPRVVQVWFQNQRAKSKKSDKCFSDYEDKVTEEINRKICKAKSNQYESQNSSIPLFNIRNSLI